MEKSGGRLTNLHGRTSRGLRAAARKSLDTWKADGSKTLGSRRWKKSRPARGGKVLTRLRRGLSGFSTDSAGAHRKMVGRVWVGIVRKRLNWIVDGHIDPFRQAPARLAVKFVEHRIGDCVSPADAKVAEAGVMEQGMTETKKGVAGR